MMWLENGTNHYLQGGFYGETNRLIREDIIIWIRYSNCFHKIIDNASGFKKGNSGPKKLKKDRKRGILVYY
jgi:hypothetical protein